MARPRVVGKPLGERDTHRPANKCNYEFLILVSLWYSGPETYIILLQVSLRLNSTLKNNDKTKTKAGGSSVLKTAFDVNIVSANEISN